MIRLSIAGRVCWPWRSSPCSRSAARRCRSSLRPSGSPRRRPRQDERGRPRDAHPGRLSGRRADPPLAVGTDHRLLVRSGAPGAAVIDPATGEGVASADPNPVERWLTNLHRSLFLDERAASPWRAGAAAMLVLSLSGAALVARRAGGWRRWFSPLRGPLPGRLHVEIARIAVLGLFLSSATALWMTASTFDLLPDSGATPAFPAEVSGETGVALAGMADAGRHARRGTARAELSLSRRRDRRLHAEDGPGHRVSRPGNRGAAGLGRPDRMGARLGNHLHAAYRTGRRHAWAGAGAHGARRARDGRRRAC